MLKYIFISAFVLVASLSAQNMGLEDIKKEMQQLYEANKEIKKENDVLRNQVVNINFRFDRINTKMDSLFNLIKANKYAFDKMTGELGSKISKAEINTNQKISNVDESLSKTALYGIIGVLSALLLSSILFVVLSKRQRTDKTDFIDQLSKTKSSIEESLVKEFEKQTEFMDTQLHLLEKKRIEFPNNINSEPDHSLALKVASEINLIERNIRLMDPKTKGLKQLQASVGKMKDNLAANGYEMPELLGKQFHQGMKVIVSTSIPDENLEKGTELITKVLIPQVNFNDRMIQTAQIEVSVGY
jgi:hypothetical protein